jgi:hypothetical protein
MNNELEVIWKKRSWPDLRYCPSTCFEGLRKTTARLSQYNRSPSRDLNPERPEYGAGVRRDVRYWCVIEMSYLNWRNCNTGCVAQRGVTSACLFIRRNTEITEVGWCQSLSRQVFLLILEQLRNCTTTRMLYGLYDSPIKPAWSINLMSCCSST